LLFGQESLKLGFDIFGTQGAVVDDIAQNRHLDCIEQRCCRICDPLFQLRIKTLSILIAFPAYVQIGIGIADRLDYQMKEPSGKLRG